MAKLFSGELLIIMMSEFLNITEADYQTLLDDSLTPPSEIACLKDVVRDQMKFNFEGVSAVFEAVKNFGNPTTTAGF